MEQEAGQQLEAREQLLKRLNLDGLHACSHILLMASGLQMKPRLRVSKSLGKAHSCWARAGFSGCVLCGGGKGSDQEFQPMLKVGVGEGVCEGVCVCDCACGGLSLGKGLQSSMEEGLR